MKNIFSKTNKKDLFFILLAPVSFVSTFFLSGIIESIIKEPNTITYLNKGTTLLLLFLISIFSIKISNITKSIYENKKKSYILTLFLVILAGLYLISFIHPIAKGIFFLEVFIPSLIINIVLTYIITLIIKGLKK